MCVTTSSTVWLACRGTSNPWKAPTAPPRQTRTLSEFTPARRVTKASSAFVEPGQHELAMAERLGRGEPSVGRTEHASEQLVPRLARRHLAPQQARHIEMSPDQAGD